MTMLFTEKDSRTIAERALSFVKAADALVTVRGRVHSHLRFAANTFQTSGRSESAGVTSGVGDRKRGEAFTSDVGVPSSRAEQAETIARIRPSTSNTCRRSARSNTSRRRHFPRPRQTFRSPIGPGTSTRRWRHRRRPVSSAPASIRPI
jgi:hypothetical protein